MQNSSDSGLEEWENVTVDVEMWSLLVRQMEDLLAIQALLKMKHVLPDTTPVIVTGEPEPINVSVKKVLDNGKGII